MAHLLGDADCIESLRRDINDLQVCVVDISSRVGPVQCKSWKYPDRQSCDLDMNELLETYDHCDDVEDTQVAHIVLYELLIDRLLLYIQSINKYTESLTKSDRASSAVNNTSIGVITMKFWNKMVKLHSTVQQLQSDAKNRTKRLSESEQHSEQKSDQHRNDNDSISLHTLNSSPHSHSQTTPIMTSNYDISRDCSNRATQTYQTAFVPCEECSIIQKNLRNIGGSVVDICKQQGIPSALSKLRPHIVNSDWMSANEVAEWTGEQSKDFIRITKQIDTLTETVRTLRSDLESEVGKCKKLQTKINNHDKEMKIEKENRAAFRRQSDIQHEAKLKEFTEKLASETLERSKVNNVKKELESQLQRVKIELVKQTETLKLVESTKLKLEGDLRDTKVESGRVQELESRVAIMSTQLDETSNKLETATKDLAHEQAKSKSATKYQQNVQSKQESLIQRVTEMDTECEELRGELSEMEEERDEIRKKLQTSQDDLFSLKEKALSDQNMIDELSKEQSSLLCSLEDMEQLVEELNTRVQKQDDNQRLLSEYPDLNGPVRIDSEGSGDLATDMHNQITANELRINILEKQNVVLRNTVAKMVQSRHEPNVQIGQPIPLWNNNTRENFKHHDQHRHGDLDSHANTQYTAQWTPPSCALTRTDKLPSRPPSSVKVLNTHYVSPDFPETIVGKVTSNESLSTAKNSSRSTLSTKRSDASERSKGNTHQIGSELGGGDLGHRGSMPRRDDAAVRTYIQMKRNIGNLPVPSPANRTTSLPSNQGTQSLACHRCDKLYTAKKDLDIHVLYCYGKPRTFGVDNTFQ